MFARNAYFQTCFVGNGLDSSCDLFRKLIKVDVLTLIFNAAVIKAGNFYDIVDEGYKSLRFVIDRLGEIDNGIVGCTAAHHKLGEA